MSFSAFMRFCDQHYSQIIALLSPRNKYKTSSHRKTMANMIGSKILDHAKSSKLNKGMTIRTDLLNVLKQERKKERFKKNICLI
jgi:uncharacterized protein YqiB (DUF1249 family)